jgi:hypothetical protein
MHADDCRREIARKKESVWRRCQDCTSDIERTTGNHGVVRRLLRIDAGRVRRVKQISCTAERIVRLSLSCSLLLACGPKQNGNEADAGAAGARAANDGDPLNMLELRPTMYTPIDLPPKLLADGDEMELWSAPQGGHVILAGVQIRGLDSEFIELYGALRDLETGMLVSEAVRTVVVAPLEGEPGWVENDRRSVSQMVHITLCPNYEPKPINGTAYELELEVTELYDDFETGSASVEIVPTCMQAEPQPLERCQCECEADYVVGKCSG